MSDHAEPAEDRMQAQRRDWKRLDDLAAEIAAERATMESDIGKVLDATPKAPPVVAKPGNYYARLALKNGNEDEYINAMKARYGGEW